MEQNVCDYCGRDIFLLNDNGWWHGSGWRECAGTNQRAKPLPYSYDPLLDEVLNHAH